jgi:hypothetical protein
VRPIRLTHLQASVSTTYAGYFSDHFGSPIAFPGLSAIATVGFIAIWASMLETRPPHDSAVVLS